ncbi:MAG: HYR domain-containing protein, partial [Nitrososphaerales archaeon]
TSDALSGIDLLTDPADVPFNTEGADQTTGVITVYDLAGNSASLTESDIDIDLTPPTVTPPPNVTFAAVGTTGAATVTYAPAVFSDPLSGIDTTSSTPASGSSLPVGLNTITHTATNKAGLTASATSTGNVFDVIIDNSGIINQGSEVNVRIRDQAADTSPLAIETVTFNVRSAAGDGDAQKGINVVATAQLPGTNPFSYNFLNGPSSLVVTSETTSESGGKLNLGNDGYDKITVKYTSTDGITFKEVSADTQKAGGPGRPATAADPFRWSSDRYLIETTGTVKAFESTLKNNGVADTRSALVATSTSGSIDTATYYSVTLTEDPGDTGTFTSPAITFSSSLATSFTGGINRLNAPAGSTVYAKYTPLAGSEIRVTAGIDGLSIPTTGAVAVTTTGAICASFGGDTDNDGICNNWENQSPLPGLNINQFPSAVYSYACKPQIDDTAGNSGRYSIHSTDPAFVTTDTTSYGCPNINQRDIYIEWDSMNGHKPSRDAIAKVIDVLATAPDPDGGGPILPGIKAHFQLDENYGFHRDQITFNKTPPTLTENYNLLGSWVTIPSGGTQVTVDSTSYPDVVKFNVATDGADKRVYKPLGFTLDNAQWKMESQFNPTAATSPNHMIFVLQGVPTGVAVGNPDTTTQDRIGVAYKLSTTNKLMLFYA